MTDTADLRIQLEGRVERLERAADAWERAARVLESNKWRTAWPEVLASDPELDAAIEFVSARADAEFGPLLNRIFAAQRRVEASAARRLERLAVDTSQFGTRQLIDELGRERKVILSQQVGWPGWARLLTIGGIAAPIVAAALMQWAAPLFGALLSVLIALSRWQQAPRILLTGGSLSLNGNGVRLDRIERVELWDRSTSPRYLLVIHARDAEAPFGAGCAAAPEELLALLSQLGITCTRVREKV